MIAVDINVIVRLLTADDAAQHARARKLFQHKEILIPVTVLLETEWVLRYSYEFEPAAITHAFRQLLGLKNVEVGNSLAVRDAIAGYEQGMDFVDALHISLAGAADSFATFDKALIKQTKKMSGVSVVEC
jgi:predicted nucleic-acid-binding protein